MHFRYFSLQSLHVDAKAMRARKSWMRFGELFFVTIEQDAFFTSFGHRGRFVNSDRIPGALRTFFVS